MRRRKGGVQCRHMRRQIAEDLAVAAGLTFGGDGRAVEQHIGVTVGAVNVPVLQLRGGRQHIVSVVGRVGHEMLKHHSKQVFASEALGDFGGLRCHGYGVAVVDHHCLDLGAEIRVALMQEHVANAAHVQSARAACAQQLRHLQISTLEGRDARTGQQQATRTVTPGTNQRGQAGDGAHGIATAAHALHAVVQANCCGLERAVVPRQLANLLYRQATDLGGALGRPLHCSFFESVPALCVLGDVVVVQPVVDDQLMHQRQRQCGVGAGQQLQMLVAFVGGFAFAGVNADELGAVALGFLGVAPEVQIAGDAVAAPDQDELALGKVFDMHAQLAAIGGGQRLAARAGADGAVQQTRAELVEKAPVHALALHHAHGACVAVGEDGLGIFLGNQMQALGDITQRFIPVDGGELARALGAAALERLQHAFGVIAALGVFADLGAQHATGVTMFCIALNLDGNTVGHGGDN